MFWRKSIQVQISIMLLLQMLFFVGTVSLTLYEMQLRKHDYEILNLAGQLRVISSTIAEESQRFSKDITVRTDGQDQSMEIYLQNVENQLLLYDKIITSFQNRELDPSITGRDDPLRCNWDEKSINQLDKTSTIMQGFREGMPKVVAVEQMKRNGEIVEVSRYISNNSDLLRTSSYDLSRTFQYMMEKKQEIIVWINQIAMTLSVIIFILILIFFRKNIFTPLRNTMADFDRAANGDLSCQVPIGGSIEISQMTMSFNNLLSRLNALFRLSDNINKGTSLDDMLKLLQREFKEFLPLDWVGVFTHNPGQTQMTLERFTGGNSSVFRENEMFSLDDFGSEGFLTQKIPSAIADLEAATKVAGNNELLKKLLAEKQKSVIIFPLGIGGDTSAVMVFAANRLNAYSSRDLELIGNLAGQIRTSLDKTVVLEGLIIVTVQGLAKLAESKDPETGDHLMRMSLYAALIVEQLGVVGPYRDQISAEYVRNIYRFASMHDIGKVGIPDQILLKPGKLDADEWIQMRKHPSIGGLVLRQSETQMRNLGLSIFQMAIDIAESHHEKFDGSGYPNGLAGQSIPLAGRIIAVADVFDALTSQRPYKRAFSIDEALEIMRKDIGSHFDPDVFQGFEQALPQILVVYENHKHID